MFIIQIKECTVVAVPACTYFLGYVTDVLEDARVYCNHGNKKEIDADDIKLAVQIRMDNSFTSPPPRDV